MTRANKIPETKDCVEALANAAPAMKPYIESIRFPFYRNLARDTKIDFAFPLTVFVGKNGTSKSSTLQAMYGSPKGHSVGDYWFATSLDLIEDSRDGLEQSFVYRYRAATGGTQDVLKLRRNRAGNPEYWEAEGPLAKYGLDPAMARAEPVAMQVLHLDFRAELSAFDKFFYFPDESRLSQLDRRKKEREQTGENKPTRARKYSKQDYIRNRSTLLSKVLDGTSVTSKSKPPQPLTPLELSTINWILDKTYVGGTIVEHALFGNQWGKTVVFKTANALGSAYSEAFAGSGEVAVAIVVHAISRAKNNALVLLDEPEVSLHPIAQSRLKRYLLDVSRKKQAQIVVSTHAPEFVRGLPRAAVKVFKQQDDGVVVVREDYTPDEAFREVAEADGKRVLVEDARAKILLTAALKQVPQAFSTLSVDIEPGGVSQIYFAIGVYCRSSIKPLVVFDGDQKPLKMVEWQKIPHAATEKELTATINEQTAGNDNKGPELRWPAVKPDERIKHMRDYLRFLEERCFYLPAATPEEAVWSDDVARAVLQIHEINDADFFDKLTSEPNYKSRFSMMAEKINSASDADTIFREFVTHAVRRDFAENGQMKQLVEQLRQQD